MSSGSPRKRDPAERPDPAAEERPHVGGDEAGEVEGVGDALVESFLANVVAVIECRHTHRLVSEHGFDVARHGLLRGVRDSRRIALAHFLPLRDAPACGAIAVGGIVRACLVGKRVRANAALQHLGQDLGGIAEQSDAGRLSRGADDLERLVDAGRAPVEVARLQALLDAAFLHLDGDAVRSGHDRRKRLRAAHAAEARGQDPPSAKIAAVMLAAHLGEGLVRALDDALRADVDPAAGRHLAVHHQALAIEIVEYLPVRPFGDQVGIGDEHPRRILVRAEHADRLARLDEQGLVFLEPLQRLDDPVETLPVARGTPDAAVDDEALRVLGDLFVEIVHQHPHRGFGGPAPGHDLAPAAGADVPAELSRLWSVMHRRP